MAAAKEQNQSKTKPLTKTQLHGDIAETTGLTRKQVQAVLDRLTEVIRRELSKKGAGVLTLPGLVKIVRVSRPATKGGEVMPNPFKPGETMVTKAKPAHSIVRLRALKSLKQMV